MSCSLLVSPGPARLRGLLCGLSALALAAGPGRGAEPAAQFKSPPDFGELGFDQLAQLKVTSVSRTASTVQQSPAAVFVIPPELFRRVPGMSVARIGGNKWTLGSSRGLATSEFGLHS